MMRPWASKQNWRKGYLVHPQVTVTVMEFSKRRFTVLGEVQKPGSYDMPDQQKVTVLQAIGISVGYIRIAHSNGVTLMRKSAAGKRPSSSTPDAWRVATSNPHSSSCPATS